MTELRAADSDSFQTEQPDASTSARAVQLRQRSRTLARSVLPPVGAFCVLVGVLYFISYVYLSPSRRFLMPPPDQVVRNGLLNHQHLHEQLGALWDTVQVAAVGLLIAFGIGAS
ncbi:MAG TPA: hypothetical protein VFM96_09070, partial [Gaiellaceae bacterium]|nr:hypothetical protein [Gaiellaceae bacterium]